MQQHSLSDVDDLTGESGRSIGLLRQISTAVKEATTRSLSPIVVAGNCMTSAGVACGLGPEILNYAVFDAHDDLHTQSTTTSGYFDGMEWTGLSSGVSFQGIARTIPGFQRIDLSEQLIFCGTRDCTDAERKLIADYGIDTTRGSEHGNNVAATALAQVLGLNLATLIHLDMDFLMTSSAKHTLSLHQTVFRLTN